MKEYSRCKWLELIEGILLIAVPPLSEQKRIDKSINVAFSHLAIIEKCLN